MSQARKFSLDGKCTNCVLSANGNCKFYADPERYMSEPIPGGKVVLMEFNQTGEIRIYMLRCAEGQVKHEHTHTQLND